MYLLGIDVGTTGARALLLDEEGRVKASSSSEYPIYYPRPGWAEQDPEDWWKGVGQVISQVLTQGKVSPREIKGIGLSGQMHGLCLLGKKGEILRRAILWCDQRTEAQCRWLEEEIGRENFIKLVLNPPFTGFTLPKILWVREKEPELLKKTYKILLPKDYIRFKLTGEYTTEVSDASGTLLLAVRERKWSSELLERLELSPNLFPPVVESPSLTGKTRGLSREAGLSPGIPVVGGGGDQAAGAVGAGIVEEGLVSSSIGTSGVIFAALKEPKVDEKGRIHTFCHSVPGMWHMMGVILSAGGSLRWWREVLKGPSYETLSREAEEVPPGSRGVIFLPYLMGERSPHSDPQARGVLFGLEARHTRRELTRAIMEGVTFALLDCLNLIREQGIELREVRVLGGGAKSKVWCQIQADIFGVPVVRLNIEEGPAYGVGLLAGVGTGLYPQLKEICRRVIKIKERIEPIPRNVELYQRIYPLFQILYLRLKEVFPRLSSLSCGGKGKIG